MSVSENFDRKFNKSMRGYNTEEVDSAIDALLRYCDELEDANREFEIANNDLIDEKSELNTYIAQLEDEKKELSSKNAELNSGMAKIESVYNGYREKFGEARDLVTNAKASASEILARANAKAEILAEEAAKKREAEIARLDAEIEKRRVLIEELDIAYNNFSEDIKTFLQSMIGSVDSFNVRPVMPQNLPERLPSPPEKEDIITVSEEVPAIEELPKAEYSAEENFTSEEEDIKLYAPAANAEPQVEPEAPLSESELFSALGPVWKEFKGEDRLSEMKIMKNSLDQINQKVIKKKSTPHI